MEDHAKANRKPIVGAMQRQKAEKNFHPSVFMDLCCHRRLIALSIDVVHSCPNAKSNPVSVLVHLYVGTSIKFANPATNLTTSQGENTKTLIITKRQDQST